MRKRAAVVMLLGWSAIASAEPPKVMWGSVKADRKLNTQPIATVLDGAIDKLAHCTSAQVVATVKLTIRADGKPSAFKITGVPEDVTQCVTITVSKLVFAKPSDGQPVTITVPLTFHPAEIQTGAFASLQGSGDVSSGFDDSNIYGGLLGNEAGETDGGFGYGKSGFGPGGGGTGEGIGVGNLGTIGHGSGTGTGYGVGGGRGGLRGRSASVPTVSIGQPTADGDLDKAIIRRYIKRNIQKITYCYEKVLLGKPGLKGTVTVNFTIAADGNVTTSKANGMKNTDVESCVADVIKEIQFPKPKSAKVVVSYPFTFRPSDDAVPETVVDHADNTHSKTANLAIGQAVVEGDFDKTVVRRYVERFGPKILDCYDQQLAKKHGIEGTVSAELTIAADGRVSSAKAHGVDPDVSSCVAGVLQTIEFPKPNGGQAVPVHMPLTFHPVRP